MRISDMKNFIMRLKSPDMHLYYKNNDFSDVAHSLEDLKYKN